MRFPSTATVAALTLLSGANAIITGITAPSTIAAGKPFNVTINTAGYIQAVYDVAAAFGIATGEGYPQSLGAIIGSEYLGPADSNIETPITFQMTVPSGTADGMATLSAAVFSLYGAVAGPAINMYNVSVTVGSTTSTTTITSQ